MATATEVLCLDRTYAAPAEAVFDAWTSEAVLRRWFHAGADWETTEAFVDLQVGGAVRVVMFDPQEEESHGGGGRYTEVDRPRRLAFTWTWDGDSRETLIEIDFEQVEAGTAVHFTHSSLRDLESVRSHEYGWNECFANLARALGSAG
jgi:uncharacterized protein YndB with AHSA1/START domain